MCKKQEYHRGLKLCLNYIRKKYLCFLFLIKSKTKKKRGKKTMAEEKTANTPKRNYEKRERTTRTSKEARTMKTTQEGRSTRTTRRTTKQTRPYHKNKVERTKKESEVSTKKEESEEQKTRQKSSRLNYLYAARKRPNISKPCCVSVPCRSE